MKLVHHKKEEHCHKEEERKLAPIMGLYSESGEKLRNYLIYQLKKKKEK